MKTTLYIDDELLAKAQALSGVKEKTQLINDGLQTLVAQLAAKRLAAMAGTIPTLEQPPRRKKNGH